MNRPAQGAQTERRPEASANRASDFARPAPVPEGGADAPLTRRQLREIAQAQQAAESAPAQAQPDQAPSSQAPSKQAQSKPVEPSKPVEAPKEPERPLSRRELRERAAAAAAEQAAADQVTESVAPSKPSVARPVPAVQPPAATGAIRALDETGQLTPVRRVAVATGQIPAPVNPVPGVEPAHNQQRNQSTGLNRVGVRESLAQVEAESAPRVYPQFGATPTPAVPTGQRTPLGSGSTAANSWAAVSESAAAPAQAATAGAARGLPAPVAVSAVPADSWSAGSWQPVGATQQQETTSQSAPSAMPPPATTPAPAEQPARSGPSAQQPVSSAPETQQDAPAVPQWGSVLGGGAAQTGAGTQNGAQNFGNAPVAPQHQEPLDNEEDDESGSWLRYTPLQFLVLIVLGLVLGGLVWQLLSVTSGSEAEESQSVPGQEQVIEFEQSYV